VNELHRITLNYERGDGVQLISYIDYDWESSAMDRKRTFGCCFSLGSEVVSWLNMKQNFVALSSIEAQYMATNLASCEVIWLRKMLVSLLD